MCVLKTARANVKGPGSIWPKRRSGVLPAAPAPGRVPRPLSPSAGKDGRTHGPAPGAAPASEAASPRPVCPTALLCPPWADAVSSRPAAWTRDGPTPAREQTDKRGRGSRRGPGGHTGRPQLGRVPGGAGGAEAPLSPGVTPASPFSAPPVGAG